MSAEFSWKLFDELPVIGILRGFQTELVMEIAAAASQGGLTNLEVTMNSPGVVEQIKALADQMSGKMNIGAGTVTTTEGMESALDAGASFIVSPIVVPEIITTCHERGIPVFPGAMTPTEVHYAWTLGADMVKLFPAGQMGPGYIKAIKAPLSEIKILATGGVGTQNVGDFIKAGADGFGVGSPLFQKERMLSKDWNWLKSQIASFKAAF